MLSKEELLKPRYKVIADFPVSIFQVGEIIEYEYDNEPLKPEAWGRALYDRYPAIFRKLEWWEGRPIEELPLYIRFGEFDKAHTIYKVEKWNPTNELERYEPWGYAEGYNEYMISLCFPNNFPSDETEYTNYINKQP